MPKSKKEKEDKEWVSYFLFYLSFASLSSRSLMRSLLVNPINPAEAGFRSPLANLERGKRRLSKAAVKGGCQVVVQV